MLASGVAVQTPVLARHLPPEQHPSLQALLAQQMSPRPPQREHMPSPLVVLHRLPAWQRSWPLPEGQQASPELPHDVQHVVTVAPPAGAPPLPGAPPPPCAAAPPEPGAWLAPLSAGLPSL
jgi:hypothetical protein